MYASTSPRLASIRSQPTTSSVTWLDSEACAAGCTAVNTVGRCHGAAGSCGSAAWYGFVRGGASAAI